ncbi:MAG: hypothetical protein ACREF7_03225 [Candidatus Saccharimonadales bacterium]
MLTPKLGHKIALSAISLLVLFFLAGFIYIYLSDHAKPPKSNSSQSSAAAQYQALKPPPKPPANAQVGVAEEAFDSPVTPGSTSSIIINTTAGAACSIVVTANGVKDNDPSLAPQKADDFGNVTWTWLVPSSTPYGDWPIKITCSYGKNWAVYNDDLIIKD